MNRLKLLAMTALLAVPLVQACGGDEPLPPPTGSIDGLVAVEGQGIDGVSVGLSNGATATTANGGMFRFDEIEAGTYTVTISNYPDDASFQQTSSPATIATDGETVTVNFPGSWIRTSAIMGVVTVENDGLGGVTVRISGTSNSETMTDQNGQYAFTGLRAGSYSVEISGFDEDDVAFGSTASAAQVAVGESKVVSFQGTYLRTSAISGQVTVENDPLVGVTVSLQGRGESRTATTNSAGQYSFGELRSGDYSVGITNPDTDEYGFDVTSKSVTIAHGETAAVPFEGIYLRTAAIMGTVTVEGVGLEDVTVTILGEGEEHTGLTNQAGQFSVTNLHAGDYSVGITGYDDDEFGFDVTTASVTVELKETATVPFTGIKLRTAGIAGTVTVEGHPISGVTVTITGGPKDEEHTTVTSDAGYYVVDRLHAGDYAVAISDFDTNEYAFEATTQSISVGLRETATVAFQGELLRTAGISGRVSVEGTGLDGVTVTLSGDADMEEMTSDGGQYAFTGLAAGDYTVAIAGWDEAAYSFAMASADLAVAEDASVIQNFDGMHTRTASVSGMLFLDEVDGDGMHSEGEPAFGQGGVPLLLQGPGVNDVRIGATNEDGSYAFEGLVAGSYRVLIDVTEELVAQLTGAGYRFTGALTGQVVAVEAAMDATVNFPFRITTQTILVQAVMGNDDGTGSPVSGVGIDLYPTYDDAANGTNMLGSATTGDGGVAAFDFARADDMAAGGQGTDHLVYFTVTGTGHEDLATHSNTHVEVGYAATDRVHTSAVPAKLVNMRASFQWSVTSRSGVPNGGRALEGWTAMGVATDANGMASYTGHVDTLGMSYEVALEGGNDGGETWDQSAALMYTHDPLKTPAENASMDLGTIEVTWTTQTLVVGVYREIDDRPGYSEIDNPNTNLSDGPPSDAVGAEMTVEVLAENDSGNDEVMATGAIAAGGMATFPGLDATKDYFVRFYVGSGDRMVVTSPSQDVDAFGEDLEMGMTVGSFGAMSGGGPEVRLCTASAVNSDDKCATFGYQWRTGAVSGNVGGDGTGSFTITATAQTGHGASGGSASLSGGAYTIDGLQDGYYDVTGTSADPAYVLSGGGQAALFHDEESGMPAAVEGIDFTVTRADFEIRGVVGNDRDGSRTLRRNNETLAGIVMMLSDGQTTETDESGNYMFGGLTEGEDYTVSAANGADYVVVRSTSDVGNADAPWASMPDERDYDKPKWVGNDGKGGSVMFESVPVESGTFHNFALVWTNGEITGEVANVSGSAADIDIRMYDSTAAEQTDNAATTGADGAFGIPEGLMEGSYDFWIEDAGWMTGLCIGPNGKPDDDVTLVVNADPNIGARCDTDGDGGVDADHALPTPDRVSAALDGYNDSERLPTLWVYDSRASNADILTGLVIAIGETEVSDTATLNALTQSTNGLDALTGNYGSVPNVPFASMNAVVTPTVSEDAVYAISHDPALAADGGLAFTGNSPGFGVADDAAAQPTTVTILVTAENGYNDHAYTFVLTRVAPAGNNVTSGNVSSTGTNQPSGTGTGTASDPLTVSAGIITVVVPGTSPACASLTATNRANDSAVEVTADASSCGHSFTAAEDDELDLVVTSEDGIAVTYRFVAIE